MDDFVCMKVGKCREHFDHYVFYRSLLESRVRLLVQPIEQLPTGAPLHDNVQSFEVDKSFDDFDAVRVV